jgi:imidazolonepropionase-like amidohydrolase
VVFTLGDPAKRVNQGPSSRMGAAAAIRQALTEAGEYRERRKLPLADRPPIDLGLEALMELLDGKRRAVIVAHRADDLLTAIRLIEAFELDAVLSGATEGYLVRDALAAAKVPVLVGPVMARSWGMDGERANASYENAALMADVGVPIGFTGGFEGYVPKVRVVLWEAAIAAANGLGSERALEALTLGGARIVGQDAELGSIDVGKRGDLVVFDGDPFEYTSHVCTVVSGGVVVSGECR